jgi:hypothetical protein
MYTALNAKLNRFLRKANAMKGQYVYRFFVFRMYDRDARLLKNGIEILIKTSKILLFILILFIILI